MDFRSTIVDPDLYPIQKLNGLKLQNKYLYPILWVLSQRNGDPFEYKTKVINLFDIPITII